MEKKSFVCIVEYNDFLSAFTAKRGIDWAKSKYFYDEGHKVSLIYNGPGMSYSNFVSLVREESGGEVINQYTREALKSDK